MKILTNMKILEMERIINIYHDNQNLIYHGLMDDLKHSGGSAHEMYEKDCCYEKGFTEGFNEAINHINEEFGLELPFIDTPEF